MLEMPITPMSSWTELILTPSEVARLLHFIRRIDELHLELPSLVTAAAMPMTAISSSARSMLSQRLRRTAETNTR